MDRGARRATVYGVTTVGHDLASKPPHMGVGALQAWSYMKDNSLEFQGMGYLLTMRQTLQNQQDKAGEMLCTCRARRRIKMIVYRALAPTSCKGFR